MDISDKQITRLQVIWDRKIATWYTKGSVARGLYYLMKENPELFPNPEGDKYAVVEELRARGMKRLPLILERHEEEGEHVARKIWYNIFHHLPYTAWLVRAIPGSLNALIPMEILERYFWLRERDTSRLGAQTKDKARKKEVGDEKKDRQSTHFVRARDLTDTGWKTVS